MKIKFPISDFRFPIEKKSAPSARNLQPSTFNLQPSERGIALVITLILLAVTLVMAVAFLTISQRERGSVTTTTDTATARLAADSALANAEAQIIASILTTNTAAYNFGLLVSTNYINSFGFVDGSVSPTNVNYDYTSVNQPLNPGQFEQNVANLFYDPRPPVFIVTNTQTGQSDFRFWLDLNRDGMFQPTGVMPATNNFGEEILDGDNNPIIVTNIGDPQWIGVLEHPDAPHGPDNKFISRYAFVAMPIGNTLDLNYIHNQAASRALTPSNDGFYRNQGVGSWELNLAAFLTDLNTNEWEPIGNPYSYQKWLAPINDLTADPNKGLGFEDALALLSYRYGYSYNSLAVANDLFRRSSPTTPIIFLSDNIDEYSDGPFPIGIGSIREGNPKNYDIVGNSWAGADNTNQFFNLSADLYDTSKTQKGILTPGFTDHLLQATTNSPSTYDRYTFYRLLSQLGTGSAPESGKINLNYSNAVVYYSNLGVPTNITIIPGAETNLVPWTSTNFFNAAANQLLRTYTTSWFQSNPSNYLVTYYGVPAADANYYHNDSFGNVITNDTTGFGLTNFPYFGITNQIPAFGVTNIPVYVNGQYVYSSAVNRLLQLTANIYDAATNRFYDSSDFPLPTLYQPIFQTSSNGIFIGGYQELAGAFAQGAIFMNTNNAPLNLDDPNDRARLQPFSFVYGVPIIIGAEKGLPNFNQFAMQSTFQLTRKLQLTRPSTNDFPTDLNQMFNCSVSNQFAVECWNSYFTNYTRPTTIWIADHIQMTLTNDEIPTSQLWPSLDAYLYATNIIDNWSGMGLNGNAASFQITNMAAILLPSATYLFNYTYTNYHFWPIPQSGETAAYESNVVVNGDHFPQPHWGLMTTNNIQVVMIDDITGRVIDYVQLRGPNGNRDLTDEILNGNNNALWLTNFVTSGVLSNAVQLPAGVENQLQDSSKYDASIWGGSTPLSQIEGFRNFIYNSHGDPNEYGETNLAIQAAYTPTATAVQFVTWQANDPLVHYLASDLFDSANENFSTNSPPLDILITAIPNERYQPWGSSDQMAIKFTPDSSVYDLAIKDPLVWRSDYWNFPAGKFPTVGWLGRVHRGTPWQTVYLKSPNIWNEISPSGPNIGANVGVSMWANWTGNFNTIDAFNALPAQDRLLFDVFTTALNDNATRGQLSVNVGADDSLNPQAGLAAWSALASGVMVLSNTASDQSLANLPGFVARYKTLHLVEPPPYLTNYAASPINPAGIEGTNSILRQLVTNINYTRAIFTNANGLVGTFEHVGDILAVPQFSDQSSFLNQSVLQREFDISDAMYEWLPQQTMSLLSCPTAGPRYVIYSYGQTLKPAPGGIVTGFGSYFGMVTNYQVVAETATRAVVQIHPVIVTNFNGFTTNYSTTIEQFNVLPPD